MVKNKPGLSGKRSTDGGLVFYRTPDGRACLEVRLDQETVWLSLQQMGTLFGRDKSVISRHLKKIFLTGELSKKSVVAKNATTGPDGKRYQVEYYNLDAVISVGYRVNSKRGIQFRQWASGVLRDFLIKGCAFNQGRLTQELLKEAENAITILSKTLTGQTLLTEEGQAILDVVRRYSKVWRLLLDYDEGRLAIEPRKPVPPLVQFSVQDARRMVGRLRESVNPQGKSGTFLGRERSNALEMIFGNLEQTFEGKLLYPSAQIRASHLFYFIIKDHPFVDGNKRLAALFFLEYLRRNKLILAPDGKPRFAGNAIVALALLIAESAPQQKDTMIRLILSLLEDE